MNLFPSVLIAGAPHTGKSVLSYLLTQHLRQMNVPHYLLRAAPDGEGDWFFHGPPENVYLLRASKKHPFTEAFTLKMLNVIRNRHLPLLVDMGGKPRGEQFGILNACTHAVLLYRAESERARWREWLVAHNVHIIAELQSQREGTDVLWSSRPRLTGVISGLERDASRRKAGLVFGALLEILAGVFSYAPEELRREHLRTAPLQPLEVDRLARRASGKAAARYRWQPGDLATLARDFPSQDSYALYGRGPAWLTAFVAAQVQPAPLALFDARFGWLALPFLRREPPYGLKAAAYPQGRGCTRLEFSIPGGFIEPENLACAPLDAPPQEGVLLSGRLPLWAYAALTVHFLRRHPWVAVYDPALDASVVVGSRSPDRHPGETLFGVQ